MLLQRPLRRVCLIPQDFVCNFQLISFSDVTAAGHYFSSSVRPTGDETIYNGGHISFRSPSGHRDCIHDLWSWECVCVYTRSGWALFTSRTDQKKAPTAGNLECQMTINIRQSSARLENYLFPHLCSKMDFSHATGMHLRVPWQKNFVIMDRATYWIKPLLTCH